MTRTAAAVASASEPMMTLCMFCLKPHSTKITCAEAETAAASVDVAAVPAPKRVRKAKPPVMDAAKGRKGREAGIARAAQGSTDEFKTNALLAIEALARRQSEFTADDVWVALDGMTSADNRALGSIMRSARGLKWIAATDRYIPTTQAARHRAPIRVWRSLLVHG